MKKFASSLVLAGLLLQIIVPMGFMPNGVMASDTADQQGPIWYLKLCPKGLSAQTMAALLGTDHVHHHHGGDAQANYEQCDLGSGLSAETLLSRSSEPPLAPELSHLFAAAQPSATRSQRLWRNHPRGPPNSV